MDVIYNLGFIYMIDTRQQEVQMKNRHKQNTQNKNLLNKQEKQDIRCGCWRAQTNTARYIPPKHTHAASPTAAIARKITAVGDSKAGVSGSGPPGGCFKAA